MTRTIPMIRNPLNGEIVTVADWRALSQRKADAQTRITRRAERIDRIRTTLLTRYASPSAPPPVDERPLGAPTPSPAPIAPDAEQALRSLWGDR